jgi:nucleotide-binding universal stress UspA family protein
MRDILVHAGNLRAWSGGVEYAARLAAQLDAALTGVYVHPTPVQLLPPFGTPTLLAEMIEAARGTEEAASAAAGEFVARMRAFGVGTATWHVAEGYAPAVLSHVADWTDLLVLERGADTAWSSPHDVGVLALNVGIPVIMVPRGEHDARIDRIALGWNASPESVRAIHAALPLLVRAKQVVVFGGACRTSAIESAWKPGFDIVNYLQRHGIEPRHRFVDASDEQAGAALLEAAAAEQADLLVMGAYGRSRLSEWAFGGATRHVLHEAKLPVLLHR